MNALPRCPAQSEGAWRETRLLLLAHVTPAPGSGVEEEERGREVVCFLLIAITIIISTIVIDIQFSIRQQHPPRPLTIPCPLARVQATLRAPASSHLPTWAVKPRDLAHLYTSAPRSQQHAVATIKNKHTSPPRLIITRHSHCARLLHGTR